MTETQSEGISAAGLLQANLETSLPAAGKQDLTKQNKPSKRFIASSDHPPHHPSSPDRANADH